MLLFFAICLATSCTNRNFEQEFVLKGEQHFMGNTTNVISTWNFHKDGSVIVKQTLDLDGVKGDYTHDESYSGTYEIDGKEVIVTLPTHPKSPFKFDFVDGQAENPRNKDGVYLENSVLKHN